MKTSLYNNYSPSLPYVQYAYSISLQSVMIQSIPHASHFGSALQDLTYINPGQIPYVTLRLALCWDSRIYDR